MTDQVQIKKSSRHIFKIPFEIPIKIFDETNKNHLILANLAKKAQKASETLFLETLKRNGKDVSKNKIQTLLNENLTDILIQIDEVLDEELKS